MTGPKEPADKWRPLVCGVCGAVIEERNPAKAVEQLETHLAVEHGIDV